MPLDINSNIITSLGAKYLNDTGIVTSGLTLHFDFGVASCYPGSGTAVTDLSPSGYAGTTYNSPSYSSVNGGGMVFNDSNTYIDINSSTVIAGTNPFTVDIFYKLTGSGAAELFGNYGPGYNGLWIAGKYGMYLGGTSCYMPGAPLGSGMYHLTCSRTSGGAMVTYKNGISVATASNSSSLSLGINYRIGTDVNSTGEPFGGSLYVLRVYNRVLSATEVLQNYNAQRQRFGL